MRPSGAETVLNGRPTAAARLVAEMTRAFERGEGYRFGESAVVSRRVHLVTSARPAEVDIITSADAGRVFYGRRSSDQIVHLDIFHEVARVDHRAMARAVRDAVDRYTREARSTAGGPEQGVVGLAGRRLADYVDIQTATGGGRITGGLGYGQGDTLRRAHLTHVHLAFLAHQRDYHLVPHLVLAVEAELGRQGCEIRRPDRLNHVSGRDGETSLDLSDYASLSDSLLREQRHDWSSPESEGPLPGVKASYLRGVLDLADEFGGVDELAEILDMLDERPTWSQLHKALRNRVPVSQVLSRLEDEGLLESERGLYNLTREGHLLHDFVTTHRTDIEMRFKMALRKLPFRGRPTKKPTVPTTGSSSTGRGPVAVRRTVPSGAGGWVGDLAVPETVVRACRRRMAGPAAGPLRLERGDLLVHPRRRLGPLDICLVIDASASMAGPRMRAAKYLAQHLLLSTRDRVAVVVFQERDAELEVPFTRNFQEVVRGLRRIRPLGLTPLAEGLVRACSYIKEERAKDPLLLLITDGIPTVPCWTMNPVADAQTAARALAKEKVRFSCIGLEPNRGFLRDLAAAARGTLHIVEELESSLLSEIAHSERRRLRL